MLGLLRALSALAAEDPVQVRTSVIYAINLSLIYFQSPLAVNTNEEAPDTKHIGVKISTLFPQSEIFGVKLVNGHLTEAQLKFTNTEVNPVNVVMIGGALWAPDPKTKGETSMIVRNITSTKYNIAIPAGGDQAVTYKFSTELHPQDLRLILQSVLTRDTGEIYQVNAYNETVSVVEPDASLFDPQL